MAQKSNWLFSQLVNSSIKFTIFKRQSIGCIANKFIIKLSKCKLFFETITRQNERGSSKQGSHYFFLRFYPVLFENIGFLALFGEALHLKNEFVHLLSNYFLFLDFELLDFNFSIHLLALELPCTRLNLLDSIIIGLSKIRYFELSNLSSISY